MTWRTDTSAELAEAAASLWNASVVRHIANSGNSVWLAERNGEPLIVRLTDPAYRSFAECRGELAYVEHLHGCGVQVASCLPSEGGNLIETVWGNAEGMEMLASVFTYAPGEYVNSSSPEWNDQLFIEWGRTLGKIHAASQTFNPVPEERRWLWKDELFLARARDLIPPDDTESIRELDRLFEWFDRLPQTVENFGMTHGDFGPQNFNYHPQNGITAFDFGNCCYHWYLSDIAVGLTLIRRYEERDRYRDCLLAGYREHFPLDPNLFAHVEWFLRLRRLYVYLSRLMAFSTTPTEEERKLLDFFRGNVHHPVAW